MAKKGTLLRVCSVHFRDLLEEFSGFLLLFDKARIGMAGAPECLDQVKGLPHGSGGVRQMLEGKMNHGQSEVSVLLNVWRRIKSRHEHAHDVFIMRVVVMHCSRHHETRFGAGAAGGLHVLPGELVINAGSEHLGGNVDHFLVMPLESSSTRAG